MVPELGKGLLILGLLVATVGALLWLGPQLPWLGRLPGDIHVERPGLRIWFPLTTSIVVSIVITVLWNLLSRWR